MKRSILLSSFLVLISIVTVSQKTTHVIINDSIKVKAKLILSDSFDNGLSKWLSEIEPSENSAVTIQDGKLDINVGAGCSVWFKEKMEGRILIEFDAIVVDNDGVNDHVQDLNTYWMASDPEYPDDIFKQSDTRGGFYRNYFPMALYYVGLGETHNKRTLLRRYDGLGNRPWIPEHNLTKSENLLTGNQLYHIKIIAYDSIIQYYRNDELLFELLDPNPFTSGHFCFRTVGNHMTLDNFKVYQLN